MKRTIIRWTVAAAIVALVAWVGPADSEAHVTTLPSTSWTAP